MKLASYEIAGTPGYGAVKEGGIVALHTRLPHLPTLLDLIRADGLKEAEAAIAGAAADHTLSEVVLTPPVIAPQKIWCIGVNYADRNAEYKDGSDAPKYPSLFVRCATSFVGSGVPVERPTVSTQLDYEGEIAFVIGKAGRHIPRHQAREHIFGLTLANEGTVRDWLRHGKFNVTQGKNFDRSGSMGPWIVTGDELDPLSALEITTRVNGEVRQHDSTERLMFPFDAIIAYLSTFATLMPGDVVLTGTPTGAGVRFDPPRWLAPGDVVEVEVPGIGILTNGVVDEAVS